MTPNEIPPAMREALMGQILVEGAGVPTKDVRVTVAVDKEGGRYACVAAVQGKSDVLLSCGDPGMADEEWAEKWPTAIAALQAATPEEREAVLNGTTMRRQYAEVYAAMEARGFQLPENLRGLGAKVPEGEAV